MKITIQAVFSGGEEARLAEEVGHLLVPQLHGGKLLQKSGHGSPSFLH